MIRFPAHRPSVQVHPAFLFYIPHQKLHHEWRHCHGLEAFVVGTQRNHKIQRFTLVPLKMVK